MGFLWGKTRCNEVAGWDERMISKLTVAGEAGMPVMAAVAEHQQRTAARHCPLLMFNACSLCCSHIAGGTGAAVGSVLSVMHQQPMVRFTAASTASFLMLAGCFSGEPRPKRWLLASVGPCSALSTRKTAQRCCMRACAAPARSLPARPPPPCSGPRGEPSCALPRQPCQQRAGGGGHRRAALQDAR
jgi:hypothetical protein